jgi:hypothetical protein
MDPDAEIVRTAELESVEERLRCAVEDLEAAAGSLAWVEQVSGPDWTGGIPSGVELRDIAQQLRAQLHRLILQQDRPADG